MLEREDLPAPEQSAAVIDQLVVVRFEHVYIDRGKVQLEELYEPFIGFVEEPALARENDVSFGAADHLPFFVAEMVRVADLGVIVHVFGPELDLGVASREIVVKGYMKRLIVRRGRRLDVITVIRPVDLTQAAARGIGLELRGLWREAFFLNEGRKIVGDLIKIFQLLLLEAFAFRNVAARQRDDYAVSNQVPEAVEIVLYLGLGGVSAVGLAIAVYIFKDRAVELLLGDFILPLKVNARNGYFLVI